MLVRWADEQRPGATDLDLLAGRIVEAVDDESASAASAGEPPVPAQCGPAPMGPATWFMLGIAALVILLLGFLWLSEASHVGRTEVARSDNVPPAYAQWPDEQLHTKAILLNEMESIFDRKLNWLAETGDRVQVDVESERSLRNGQVLAVRVVIQRRPVGQREWTLAWAIDVVTRSEELVLLRPGKTGEPQFELWAYALPDGMIALDTDVSFHEASSIRSATSEVQADREPREVFKTEADGFEFRVFQTAAVLHDRLS